MPAELLVACFIIFIEAAGIPFPIPGSLLLMEAGRRYEWSLPASVAIILLASVAGFAGSLILFAFARYGGAPFLAKYGERVGATPARVESAQAWFDRYGQFAIFLGRLMPGMRTVTAVLAGTIKVSWLRYGVSAGLSSLVWSIMYYAVGSVVAARLTVVIGNVVEAIDIVPRLLLALSLVALLAYAGRRGIKAVKSRRRDRQTKAGVPDMGGALNLESDQDSPHRPAL